MLPGKFEANFWAVICASPTFAVVIAALLIAALSTAFAAIADDVTELLERWDDEITFDPILDAVIALSKIESVWTESLDNSESVIEFEAN